MESRMNPEYRGFQKEYPMIKLSNEIQYTEERAAQGKIVFAELAESVEAQ